MKQLEAIRLGCLEKDIDLELILEKWQVSRLEPGSHSSAIASDPIRVHGEGDRH